jgi:tetratricopeptide (TPR) repeat protein
MLRGARTWPRCARGLGSQTCQQLYRLVVLLCAVERLCCPRCASAAEDASRAFREGVGYAQGGSAPEAMHSFRRCIELAPSHPTAALNLATLLHSSGRNLESMAVAEDSLAITGKDDADSIQMLKTYGAALRGLGRHAEAVQIFERIVDIESSLSEGTASSDAWVNLGIARKTALMWAQAAEAFQRALGVQPREVSARYNLGRCQEQLGLHVQARASYRAALAVAPDRSDIRVTYAFSLLPADFYGFSDAVATAHRVQLDAVNAARQHVPCPLRLVRPERWYKESEVSTFVLGTASEPSPAGSRYGLQHDGAHLLPNSTSFPMSYRYFLLSPSVSWILTDIQFLRVGIRCRRMSA